MVMEKLRYQKTVVVIEVMPKNEIHMEQNYYEKHYSGIVYYEQTNQVKVYVEVN